MSTIFTPLMSPPMSSDLSRPRAGFALALGLVTLVGFGGGFVAWATLAPLAEAAIAPGTIKVEGTRRTLQHLEGGIVREILVRDGDRVRRGQVVMRLDDEQSGATMQAAAARRSALQAQQARLSAELAGAPVVEFPPALLAQAHDPRVAEAIAGQRALFNARQSALDSQLAVLANRREQALAEIAAAEGQLGATERQVGLLRSEEAMRRDLVRQGLSRLPELLAVQRTLAGAEGGIAEQQGRITRAQATMREAESQARAARDQRAQEAGAEARDVANRLAEAEERERAAADISARREIVAPEDGTIVNSRVFNLGAVIRAGDPVMDLVPAQDRLVAEVQIQPNDIDVVHIGLPAEVRLPAFRQRLVPTINGRVTFVAADVAIDQQARTSYYRAHIQLDATQLAQLPAVALTPGMPIETHVRLGERTFWRYLTQPIRDSFARAFKEN
jgi:HlyD family type I secretion membrane fusion protein